MSPRPRYEKLPQEKRLNILEAAAVEFGKHGFDGASLNKIIARAGISKGATYYYFDDKADLFMTVAEHLLILADKDAGTGQWGESGDFWGDFEAYVDRFLKLLRKIPWAKGVIHALIDYAKAHPDSPAMQRAMDFGRAFGSKMIERGQELGEIRDDLPMELLIDVMLALDYTVDRWALDTMDINDEADLERWGATLVDLFRRLLERREP